MTASALARYGTAALVGALAPAIFFSVEGLVKNGGPTEDFWWFLAVWGIRDVVIALFIALPLLALTRKLGLVYPAGLWGIAALVAAPMGYVLANPAVFDWQPSEEDFEHGAYWGRMASYMVLFGLSGLVFGKLASGHSKTEKLREV